ncbi:DUF4389 domain-containing protein [Arthrobacter gengyunqii]|uniref:DUF4389 domain-containing protein n=1 Tax=Arthrobacter gengyunqii TaxID=2886940 RepID=A0ABS8GFG6_9MICC|nr:DUF4389 domain-containing protein [Arthrobacter gengyunqii]MCC3265063.1 DUF4389 domain-containing protein [Arthrobacter gengyunqii]
MRTGRIVMFVIGCLLILFGLGLAAGAAAVGVVNAGQGDDRFFSAPEEVYEVDSYALTVPDLEVDGVRSADEVATFEVKGESTQAGQELFIGVGPSDDVDRYLLDVQHSELQEVNFRPFRTDYLEVTGTQAPAPPGEEDFWVVSSSGSGEQSVEWNLDEGDWSAVVMNADGSRPVSAELQVGVRSDVLQPLTWILLISSIVCLVAGIALVVIGSAGLRRRPAGTVDAMLGPTGQPAQVPGPPQTYGQMQDRYGQEQQPAAGNRFARPVGASAAGAAGFAAAGAVGVRDPGLAGPRYPVRLYGEIDPDLSRWMWLVKWFLAIPHYIVLFFLWIAFFVSTVVAGFAILFTGRYPHGLFEFNVGVVRWSWRVTFYATRVLGTDRYPPFTLDRTDYPADFSVDYPRELSRWLVLVKWWLLVIPQALVVGAFTEAAIVVNRFYVSGGQETGSWTGMVPGGTWADAWDEGWESAPDVVSNQGLSLLALLVLIAAVILLFRGRYPRHLFDLIMGLNRWSYRVLAYAALMRDEYPPFRLDQGPADRRDEAAGLGRPELEPGPGTGRR